MLTKLPYADDLEARTKAYGRHVFAHLAHHTLIPFTPAWWDDRLMAWTMNDEAVKVQLFRFVDVLPMLGSTPSITRHLREYFSEAGPHLPSWMRFGLRWLPADGWTGRMLARTAKRNAERLARRFIAGTTLPEALAVITQLRRHTLAFTL